VHDEIVEVLRPDGSVELSPDFPRSLAPERGRDLYRTMRLTRAVDDEAVRLQRQGELGTYSPCRGQEAAQVGTAAVLDDRDWIFPSYRETGAALLRAIPPAAWLQRARGTWLSGYAPNDHRFGLITIPIATQTLHAVGYAMGVRRSGSDVVVMTYLGDGATSEGDAHEAMNFAAIERAPVIFVIQNNGWAISVPTHRQTRAPTLAHRALGYGMPGVRVDGNDLLACYAVAGWAVERARAGEGPAVIEAVTYRLGPHTTSDDPTRYRSNDEVGAWEARDPLVRVEAWLRAAGSWTDDNEAATVEAERHMAGDVRGELLATPRPDPDELFAHVYVSETTELRGQRDELERELHADS
jgi:pyruvate dehydrogenase E1 component alpha subunit